MVWFYNDGFCPGRMDPDVMTYDQATKGIEGKYFIPRDARMCGL